MGTKILFVAIAIMFAIGCYFWGYEVGEWNGSAFAHLPDSVLNDPGDTVDHLTFKSGMKDTVKLSTDSFVNGRTWKQLKESPEEFARGLKDTNYIPSGYTFGYKGKIVRYYPRDGVVLLGGMTIRDSIDSVRISAKLCPNTMRKVFGMNGIPIGQYNYVIVNKDTFMQIAVDSMTGTDIGPSTEYDFMIDTLHWRQLHRK